MIHKLDDDRAYSDETRGIVERIGVITFGRKGMRAVKAWQPERHEEPEQREERLLAMQRRLLR